MRKTALYDQHQALGAKLVEYCGYQLPLQFEGIVAEHLATRTRAGLFDVSHMGKLAVGGKDSLAFLQKLQTRDLEPLPIGRAAYTLICNEKGGVLDDVLVYRLGNQDFLLVVNAVNTQKIESWLGSHRGHFEVDLRNETSELAQLALQGPLAEKVLQLLCDEDLAKIKAFSFSKVVWQAQELLISRTGYSGEDGFEIYLPSKVAAPFWQSLLEKGGPLGLMPAGLGARDSLRLEAALPLYGQELDESTSPLEAGLGFFVHWHKDGFWGKEALAVQKEQGPPRKRIGLELQGRALPRTGFSVLQGDEVIGQVTSGGFSPTLQRGIGMALIRQNTGLSPGDPVAIEIRGRRQPAKVVRLPFYRRED